MTNPTTPKTDEQAAEAYANRPIELNRFERADRKNDFLAGCHHARQAARIDLDRYERLVEWVGKFKTYIECVERNTNLVEFLGDARHNPPNTTEEEYLLGILKEIMTEQGK